MDSVNALIDALKSGGPYAMAAIVIAAWWLERQDRKEKEIHLREIYERTISLAVETKVTVEKMQGAVMALTDAIRALNGRQK